MTLQQLRYVTAVAGTGTISHAVQQFYISQPSLINAIRELEQEVGLTLSKTESSVVSQTLLEYLRPSRQRKDTPQIKKRTKRGCCTRPNKKDQSYLAKRLYNSGLLL